MSTTMSVKSAPKDAKDQTMQAPDEKTFWRKMKGSVKKAGEEIAVMGIKSWLAMTDSNTTVRHKAILGGALAYFVLPTDMVPDVLAGVGFTDDMAALTLAANSVGNAITEEHEERAREKLNSMAD
ncbi:TPA: YkvA family protein [Vibrio diabolicus]|uniref:YkvA family protein n=1 Tax=Vibrio diabolicus TaxID=50719 RepID=UPI00215EF00B|nr:YkvA family protein [Vibrio diabolicus]MCS0357622.1 YkvA family protein [Vibrio diabolicus]